MNWFSDNVNQIALLGAAVIILATVFVVGKYIKQMKTDRSTGVLADDTWDGIGEYKNPLPMGWAITFLLTMIWAMWYLTLGYPVNSYSQIGEWNEEVQAYNKAFEEKHKNIKGEELTNMGEGVFLVQCAPCHGIDAEGINGKAQGFVDQRMTKEQVLDVINRGSAALGDNPAGNLGYPMMVMPPMMATGADAEAIAEYVSKGMKGDAPVSFAACSSCHGVDGKGLGGQSPNIAEFDEILIMKTLEHGKVGSIGDMPKFNDGRLSDIQKRAVSTYILSLSK